MSYFQLILVTVEAVQYEMTLPPVTADAMNMTSARQVRALTVHADAYVSSPVVEARGVVLTRRRQALVDVHLAARTRQTNRTVAPAQ